MIYAGSLLAGQGFSLNETQQAGGSIFTGASRVKKGLAFLHRLFESFSGGRSNFSVSLPVSRGTALLGAGFSFGFDANAHILC